MPEHIQGRYAHARKRALERYGLRLAEQDCRNIASRIRHRRNARQVHDGPRGEADGTERWLVVYAGLELCVAYRPPLPHLGRHDGVVVTLLPRHWLSTAPHRRPALAEARA